MKEDDIAVAIVKCRIKKKDSILANRSFHEHFAAAAEATISGMLENYYIRICRGKLKVCIKLYVCFDHL